MTFHDGLRSFRNFFKTNTTSVLDNFLAFFNVDRPEFV